MLGIKTIMAENDHSESLIFDEIDSGISGDVYKRQIQDISLATTQRLQTL